MLALRPGGPLIGDRGPPRDRFERERRDEVLRAARQHGHDVVTALLQPARDFDRLVSADAAGDAQRDARHQCSGYGRLRGWIAVRRQGLDGAPQDFLLGDLRRLADDLDLRRAPFQELSGTGAGDRDEFEGVGQLASVDDTHLMNEPFHFSGGPPVAAGPAPTGPARTS